MNGAALAVQVDGGEVRIRLDETGSFVGVEVSAGPVAVQVVLSAGEAHAVAAALSAMGDAATS